ncbi:DUF1573 domain-containing protein [Candidatus Nomurabacteria bacterium]|nr:DUF1573 domain-containing protein [Candidatus Nomurabacteria bacterium]
MNNKTIVIAVFVLLLGGLAYYTVGYNRHTDSSDSHEAMMGAHDDGTIEPYEIYPGDVAEKIKNNDNIVLLDVRTPEEYAENHLKGALLLPVQELSQQSLNAIGLGENAKDKEIYLYCRSGSRSQTAYNIMRSLGYTNIKSVAGGMIHWEEDNYPFTESGVYEGNQMMNGETMMPDDATGPHITFNQTSHDFGVIPQYGGKVETTFTVTNTGKETLQIGDLTTSCSCTSAMIAETSIEPGKSTTLTVVFDPNFHEEPLDVFKRTVFIPTNDPRNPEAEVSITVDIAEGQ